MALLHSRASCTILKYQKFHSSDADDVRSYTLWMDKRRELNIFTRHKKTAESVQFLGVVFLFFFVNFITSFSFLGEKQAKHSSRRHFHFCLSHPLPGDPSRRRHLNFPRYIFYFSSFFSKQTLLTTPRRRNVISHLFQPLWRLEHVLNAEMTALNCL